MVRDFWKRPYVNGDARDGWDFDSGSGKKAVHASYAHKQRNSDGKAHDGLIKQSISGLKHVWSSNGCVVSEMCGHIDWSRS